ncbi:hypothetical protein AJ78_04869 [Emergomyces pasteurianus Ep9510]|uniref:Uncharacterized protein n=1 Tax=Emergomyces pasteurianus Ep9510 TaxID=1447872 RepID=A0A1J9QHY7_9EURO|nr:hypothetical protein AJ78_04869 [Emergomyces pasteurianus Ep9510]
MKVAEILSDLTSLRACGHAEALALVNVHETIPNSEQQHQQDLGHVPPPIGNDSTSTAQSEELRRARDLVELHNDITLKQLNSQTGSLNEELRKARRDVDRVLQELG